MTWDEFRLARLHLAEERVGSRQRGHDREELAKDEQSSAILRARGMVSDGPS